MSDMIDRKLLNPDKALEIILGSVPVLGTEVVDLGDSLDRTLAEDVVSGCDIPAFDNSSMDGYAVIAADTRGATQSNPRQLVVISEEPAGRVVTEEVTPGTAVRIMTGAAIPDGADAVVMIEHTSPGHDGNDALINHEISQGANVRYAGGDIKRGEAVLESGTRIGPAEMGILASLNMAQVHVYKKPRVALITTGSEVVDVGEDIKPGQIRDSNHYCLLGQVQSCGGVVSMLRRVSDEKGALEQALCEAADNTDAIITTGGVSVGRYDLVRDIVAELGEVHFWRVAIKPGKPLVYAGINGRPVFGLPGNPVSSMVTFDLFVKPALLKMSGVRDVSHTVVSSVVQQDIRHDVGRREFVRAVTVWRDGGYISTPTGNQGSGRLSSMLNANSYVVVPEDRGDISAEEQLEVILRDP